MGTATPQEADPPEGEAASDINRLLLGKKPWRACRRALGLLPAAANGGLRQRERVNYGTSDDEDTRDKEEDERPAASSSSSKKHHHHHRRTADRLQAGLAARWPLAQPSPPPPATAAGPAADYSQLAQLTRATHLGSLSAARTRPVPVVSSRWVDRSRDPGRTAPRVAALERVRHRQPPPQQLAAPSYWTPACLRVHSGDGVVRVALSHRSSSSSCCCLPAACTRHEERRGPPATRRDRHPLLTRPAAPAKAAYTMMRTPPHDKPRHSCDGTLPPNPTAPAQPVSNFDTSNYRPPAGSSQETTLEIVDLPIRAAAINKHQTPPGGLEWHFARPSFRPCRPGPPGWLPAAASLAVQQTVPKGTKSADAPPPHPDLISAVRPASSQLLSETIRTEQQPPWLRAAPNTCLTPTII
ncbi:hypothetical protein K491DRAFT_680058 [Lophiostoma macrostomum CBS 122681]|uniref:Uncharacterized protein n=1 Tax=Lophiostoma macrostomum CBS 122681 TaxID=1314788 RepID=A0A6A6T536_9PLEO|nr:hypothetical protein K491DRAFT_680058 [Lophiostoma macrostomum CBS 122681]